MRVVIKKINNKATFLPLAGTQGDRCSWEMAAVGQSKGVTAAPADTPKAAQNEFASVPTEPWPCVFGSGCHTHSAAGAGVSSPEMFPGQAGMELGPWACTKAAAPLASLARGLAGPAGENGREKHEEIPAFYMGLSSVWCLVQLFTLGKVAKNLLLCVSTA